MELILQKLGNFGRYQAFLYGLVFLPGFMAGLLALTFSWTGYIPNVRCRMPFEGSDTNYSWVFDANLTRYYYPKSDDYEDEGDKALCKYYPTNGSCSGSSGDCGVSQTAIKCDHGYVYDTSLFKSSLIMTYDMVCEDAYKREFVRVAFMLGVFLGAAVLGPISDRYGRRPLFIGNAVVGIVFLNIEFLINDKNYYLFLLSTLISGFIQNGGFLLAYIVFMEVVGGFPKTLCGIWYQAFYTTGMFYAALVAYFVREWWLIQILYGVPPLFYLAYYWLFPESIRWALSKNRTDLAQKLINRAGKWNKVDIPEKLIVEAAEATAGQPQSNMLSLFTNGWYLARTTSIVTFTWLAVSMGYYGLTFNTSDLPGDVFASYMLSAAAELPGYLICVPMMQKLGRRTTHVVLIGVGGVSCIISGLIGNKTQMTVNIRLVLALVGKMCMAAAYALIYNYSVEIYPTVVRSSGTSLGSMSARIGSMAAPLIHNLADYVLSWLPIVIYGSVAVVAAFLGFFLPETMGRDYPETIEDAIHFEDKAYWEAKKRAKEQDLQPISKL
uniref:Major facilitator superfamily (MFS) profile domain-containing protein n=1 Tax=Plectus sambesii TaxID=2011161 RepID=A0A914XBX3_9BILA